MSSIIKRKTETAAPTAAGSGPAENQPFDCVMGEACTHKDLDGLVIPSLCRQHALEEAHKAECHQGKNCGHFSSAYGGIPDFARVKPKPIHPLQQEDTE